MNSCRKFVEFLLELFRSREMIWALTKQDIANRYLGSVFGFLWAFIQPTVTILVFWFVFEVGFKSMPVDDVPFILWLMCGMIPWFFLSDSIAAASPSVLENAYLVKKVVFRVSVLPLIKIFSALVVQCFFIAVLLGMFLFYSIPLTTYALQLLYYLLYALVLVMGISWLTSSLIIFLKDVGQFVSIMLQFGFWMTPIFWFLKMVPEPYRELLQLNPAFYLVEGYRNSLIYQHWFWEDGGMALYYWVVAGSVFCLGALVFRRLRPHFADVI